MNSFFFTYLSFLFKSFFGFYIEAARFYLLSSVLQESLRILFVLSALSHRPVMTRVSLFSGVRDAVLMCNKIGCRRSGKIWFLHDSVHIHEDGSSEILRNLQESVYYS